MELKFEDEIYKIKKLNFEPRYIGCLPKDKNSVKFDSGLYEYYRKLSEYSALTRFGSYDILVPEDKEFFVCQHRRSNIAHKNQNIVCLEKAIEFCQRHYENQILELFEKETK